MAEDQAVDGGPSVEQDVPLSVDDARTALYQLVKDAEEGRTTVIRRRRQLAELAPLQRLPAAQYKESGLASHTLTAAQKKLGDLVADAAAGNPQVLLRRSTPVAVLLPVTDGQLAATPELAATSAAPAPETNEPVPAGPQEEVPLPSARSASAGPVRPRRLASLGDVVDGMLAATAAPPVMYGLATLDAATGGLQPGHLVLIAAAPGAGGSLLATAAARHTALTQKRPVLYAASGLKHEDAARRMIAAEAGVDYQRLRAGELTGSERAAVGEVSQRLTQARLFFDHGEDLTAQTIAESAPYIEDLALVVVDRLQYAADPHTPLSGPAVVDAARALAHLARSLQVPVLAAFDSDDPAAVAALDPDVTLTLTRRGERAQVVVSERDFGPLATVELRAELPYTRFADLGTDPVPVSHPAPVARPTAQPETPAAKEAFAAEQVLAPGEVSDAEMGGEPEVAEKGTVFPALAILRACADEHSKMHPVRVIRKDLREGAPWTLFSEVMDGEPRWVHPEVERVRTRGGKRDELIVPDDFGAGQLLTVDRNGSYPSACSAVPLAPNILHHTGPLEARANDQAGAFQITVPGWNHAEMPHPLGRIADRMNEDGRAWVTTPHLKHLEKLIRQGLITEPLTIHDSWTGRLNESLFKPFYQAAKDARTELLAAGGGEPYVEYKRRLSIGLRLIWPKGEKVISPFWRPDWRMSLVAEASVRHWATAWRAVQAGATLVALRNVDEAVFFTPDATAPAPYKVGTGFGEVKIKIEGDEV